MLTDKRRKFEREQAVLSRDIAAIQERLSIEQDKAASAGVSAKDAHAAFREWLSKFSIAAGRKKAIPKRHGVSEEEPQDARSRLRVILADLVHVIWCDAANGEIILVFRHDPKGAVSVMLGGFTVFTEEDE